MIKEAIGTGNTVEEARADARDKLAAPLDAEVTYETISLPAKKVLGLFGGKKAEIRAYYEIPDEVKPADKPERKKAEPAIREDQPKKAPVKDKPAKQEPVKAAPAPEKKESAKPAEKAAAVQLIDVDKDPVYAYLRHILDAMDLGSYTVTPRVEGDEYVFDVDSEEDYGIVIGRRGETLDAIQYLARLVDNRADTKPRRRVSVNVGTYRQKRTDSLRALALRHANQVRKYGRKVVLDPMNPYERRVIHTAVQEVEGVTSYSVGSDGERKVVIALADGVEATDPKPYRERGGYGDRDRRGGGRSGRGGRGGYGSRRDQSPAPEAPSRPPMQDGSGVLYGRIEVPSEKPADADPEE